MSTNINLLLNTDEDSLRRKKRIKIFNAVAAISLIGAGLMSLGIFMSIQAINPASLKKEQDNVQRKISQLQDRQAKLFLLHNRVENIDKILKVRKNLPVAMNGLLVKVPDNLSVETLEINDKLVIVSGQSRSLYAIGEFINNLTDMAGKKEIIKSLTLNSLSFDEGKNVYQISVKSDLQYE